MSVTIPNSPIHGEAIITYPYGVSDSGYSCGWHTGVDIVPHGSTENLPLLYSCVNGTVVRVNNTPNNALGVNVQIKDDNGYYWRYCHMTVGSVQVRAGQRVTTGNVIGRMGSTGNVTGRHLHLECSTTISWQCSTFVNPCKRLGIPNVDNTIIYFDGEVPPPSPSPDDPDDPEPEPSPDEKISKSAKKWIFSKCKKFRIKY